MAHDFRGLSLWPLDLKHSGRASWWQEHVVEERSLCHSEQEVGHTRPEEGQGKMFLRV